MWVLSTDRAELQNFSDSAAICGGYAILSHTWVQTPPREQTFQEVQRISEQCKSTGENPRDRVGEKIRRCCQIAEHDGYKWVWIDSCCINKESSTELSEAINSMFKWYALAEVCYVYLEDVDKDDNPGDKDSKFRKARWHTRGWTLQELLAPVLVVFFSQTWEQIGTKYSLRHPLSQCAGIDAEYLARERDFQVDASIAKRMSWAANRKTTRIEDEAYCLLGLFDINIPVIYGEGRQAFQRLQAELFKQHIDTSLFAWGSWHDSSFDGDNTASLSLVHNNFHNPDVPQAYLFAPSPSYFSGKSDVYPTPQSDTRAERLYFELTPYGMKCHFPIAKFKSGITIAVLLSQTETEYLGLLLHPAMEHMALDSSRELYSVSWAFGPLDGSVYKGKRVACLGGDMNNLKFRGEPVVIDWRDVYIMAQPPITGRTDGARLLQRSPLDVAPMPFRIPRTLLQCLGALGFSLDSWVISTDPASKYAISLVCENTATLEGFRILLGLCTESTSGSGRPRHWAWAGSYHRATWRQCWTKFKHDCATDHIEGWDNIKLSDVNRAICLVFTRTLEDDADRVIHLVFTPCPHVPDETLVLSLELSGSIYKMIQHSANVYIQDSANVYLPHLPCCRSVGASCNHPLLPPRLNEAPPSTNTSDVQQQICQVSDSLQNARVADIAELKESINNLQDLLSHLLSSLRAPSVELHPRATHQSDGSGTEGPNPVRGEIPPTSPKNTRHTRTDDAATVSPRRLTGPSSSAALPSPGPSSAEKPKKHSVRRLLCGL